MTLPVGGVEAQRAKAERFLALHDGPAPLLLPNPWDAGSAKLLAALGFEALPSAPADRRAVRYPGRADGGGGACPSGPAGGGASPPSSRPDTGPS